MTRGDGDDSGGERTSDAAPPSANGSAPGVPRPPKARRVIGIVGWTIALVLAALALFYGRRAASNRDQLTDRNLRELGRIAATVQGTVEGFGTGLMGLARADSPERLQRDSVRQRLVPSLIALRRSCAAHSPYVLGQAIDTGRRSPQAA